MTPKPLNRMIVFWVLSSFNLNLIYIVMGIERRHKVLPFLLTSKYFFFLKYVFVLTFPCKPYIYPYTYKLEILKKKKKYKNVFCNGHPLSTRIPYKHWSQIRCYMDSLLSSIIYLYF